MTALMKMVFVTIFIALNFIAGGINAENCDPKILETCYLSYFNSLSIPTPANSFPAYNDYLTVFNAYNTPSKLRPFCDSVYALTKCLEKTDQKCISPEGFMMLNITNEDAYDFPTNYGIIQYTCGTGLEAWKEIINCTTVNSDAINKANTKCEETFVTTKQTCSDLVTFLQCTYVLLKQDCGQDAYTFACKADTTGIKYSTPSCVTSMIDCDSTSAAAYTSQFYYCTVIMITVFYFFKQTFKNY